MVQAEEVEAAEVVLLAEVVADMVEQEFQIWVVLDNLDLLEYLEQVPELDL